MNKYRPGGRCGGSSAEKQANPEFNASLASLLQQRERQDALFAPASAQQQQPQQQPQPQQAIQLRKKENQPKPRIDDINFLLEGDYEE
jgi:hypothetical protein